MTILKSFLAGFFSTLLFHQGVIAIFNLLQVVPFKAYDMTPTQPLGVPSVISLAFFAGIWGVVIWMMIKNRPRKTQLIGAIVLGAILPTIVAFAVVLPLKGIEFKPAYIPFGLLLNGIWGLGLWILMYLMNKAFIRQGTTSMKFIIILSMLSASLIACATISDSGGTKSMAGTRMTCHADQELVASCIATRADGDSKLAMDDAQEVAICRLDNQY